jgi:hypothetical protein
LFLQFDRRGICTSDYATNGTNPPRADSCEARLPDGLFAYQKKQFWYILEGVVIEKTDMFFS